MPKLNIFIGAILLVSAVHMSQAVYKPFPLNMVDEAVENLGKLRDTILCMTRTCDPEAVYKAFMVDDAAEASIMQKANYKESNQLMALKIAKAIANALKRLQVVEPVCKDASYTCPNQVLTQAPAELYQFADYLNTITSLESCFNMGNVQQIIKVMGEAGSVIEHNPIHGGTSVYRMIPAVAYVAKTLSNMCNVHA
ncbi:uncharacterized protein LOC142231170 [Haematobia irritans]|uniref:uncharacterized protein LOC142231170 n=1 Tax=Haematobia irritans TaxID=7368 RepID=UPI003F50CC06